MELVTDTPEIKRIINELLRKRVVCGKDIQTIETRLRDKYANEIQRKDRTVSSANAEEMANAFVENVFHSQSAERIIDEYTGKNGKIRAPGSSVSNSFKSLISRFSRKNRGASASSSSFVSRLGSLGSRVGSRIGSLGSVFTRKNRPANASRPANARNTNMKSVMMPVNTQRKSVVNRFKGLFGSKKNTRKVNTVNSVNSYKQSVLRNMEAASNMNSLKSVYNTAKSSLKNLGRSSQFSAKAKKAIDELGFVYGTRSEALRASSKNPFANGNKARKNQAALLAKKQENMNIFGPPTNRNTFNLPPNTNKPSAAPASTEDVDLLNLKNSIPVKSAAPPASAAAPAAVPAAPPAAPAKNPFADSDIAKQAAKPKNNALAGVNPFAGGARRRSKKRGSRK